MLDKPQIVIVGKNKPLLNYVTACITIFNQGHKKLIIRARGEAINIAVEAATLLKRRFIRTLKVSNIDIDEEVLKASDGRSLRLPVIEIEISK